MVCQQCGKEISEGQTFCHHCGAPAAGRPRDTRMRTPWEDRSGHGFVKGLIRTLKESMFNPTEFFKSMPVTGGLTDPLLYAMIIGMIGTAFSYLWQVIFQATLMSCIPLDMEIVPDYRVFQAMGFAVAAVIMPFMIIIVLFIWSGILHLFLMMAGGAKAGFEATFRAAAYSNGPLILNVIPFCGGVIAWIWSIVLVIIGLREAQKASTGKAVFAVLAPLVLCCGLILAGMVMMGLMAAAASGIWQ